VNIAVRIHPTQTIEKCPAFHPVASLGGGLFIEKLDSMQKFF
jgi:hypothetical protein